MDVAMPLEPGLDSAILSAEELVARGLGGEATVAVASLPRGSIRSDAEPLVRTMLAEFEIQVPPAEDEDARYELLLRSFASWGLPLERFEGPFYARLTSWDRQSDLDRELMRLLDERDHAPAPGDRLAIERRMRAVAEAGLPPL